MSAPATTQDHYSLHEVVRAMKQEADIAASVAAEKARTEAEKRFMTELRGRYAGQTLFCYDDSSSNRFHQDPRKWAAVALSFEECVAKMQPHVVQYSGEDRWSVIESQINDFRARGELPNITTGQRIVFRDATRWYCFFSITGEDYCNKVEEHLALERKSDKEEASRGCGCDNYDNL